MNDQVIYMEKAEIIKDINDFLVEATWKDIGIDSLDFVDIVVIIEKNYGFKLKGEDMANIRTLEQFYDHIHQLIPSKY